MVGVVVAAPIAVFLLLAVALMLPPVQRAVVGRVCAVGGRALQCRLSVGQVRLAFPLDLALHDVLATRADTTLLSAAAVRVDVRLWPLLSKRIEVDGASLYEARVNTLNLLSDVRVEGRVRRFEAAAHGIDLGREAVRIDHALLRGANLLVVLSDTAQQDTTPSTARWVISVDKAEIEQSRVEVRLAGDSVRLEASLQRAVATDGRFDTGAGLYAVAGVRLRGSALRYDRPHEPRERNGFDPAHIAISGLNARVDSLRFGAQGYGAHVVSLSLKEQSGLSVNEFTGRVAGDSARLHVSGLALKLPHSALQATAHIDLSALGTPAKGRLAVSLAGRIDRRDVLDLAGKQSDLGRTLVHLPATPLAVSATVSGNSRHLVIGRARLGQAGAYELTASGHIDNAERPWRSGRLNFALTAPNLDFVHTMAGLDGSVRLPHHMKARGTATLQRSRVGLDLQGRVGTGRIALRGHFDPAGPTYHARLSTTRLPLQAFLPDVPVNDLSLRADVSGRGTDVYSPAMRLEAQVQAHHLRAGNLPVDSVQLVAALNGGRGRMQFNSQNDLLRGEGLLTLATARGGLTAALKSRIDRLNLQRLTAGSDTLALAAAIDLTAHAGRGLKSYGAEGRVDGLRLTAQGAEHTLRSLGFKFDNRADTLWARLQSGDLDAALAARGNAGLLAERVQRFVAAVQGQMAQGRLHRATLRRLLPDMGLLVRSGSDNPLTAYLRYAMGYELQGLDLRFLSTPHTGIRAEGRLSGLNTGALLLDSTSFRLSEDSTRLNLAAAIVNYTKNNPYPFEARLDGFLNDSLVGADVVYKDKNGGEGIRLGTAVAFSPEELKLRITTPHPVIAYRRFAVNADNYIAINRLTRDVVAHVDLLADDGTGLKLYSNEEDSIPDVTVSVSRLNLGELTAVVPYLPRISGYLNGDVHVQKENKIFSAVSDLHVSDMHYEDAPLGNIGLELSYMPDENLTEHFVDAQISRSDSVVAQVVGKYLNTEGGRLNMNLELLNFPLDLLNGFAGGSVAFAGTARGELSLTGAAAAPRIDGQISTDSIRLYSDVYGFNLHTDSQTLHIADNRLNIEALHLYSIGRNPLTVAGGVDFKNPDRIALTLNMNAKNFEIINAPKTKQSEVYGRVLANYQGTVRGTTSNLQVRGMLSVLRDSRIGYVLKDSPLSVDDRLSDLVVFTNFSDTTAADAVKQRPELSGIDVMLGINIDEAAQLHCDLSSDEQSYFDVEGGGSLTFKYLPDGSLTLTGRYTMGSGEMKYTLPVIPLRTFKIVGGSYIEFTGEPTNPTLNIRATERLRASVNEDNNPRTVPFDVGVSLTKQLSNMGLEFTIEAPDDGTVQNQLAAMSREQRGKLAVSMLVTGMYLAENNSTSGFTANNALNAFLQSEIQQIAGNAMKSIDLSLSVDNGTTTTGSGQTDYSFRFAKRLWGNRVSIVIGGRVSTGAEAQNNAGSFIDNVALEYRLNRSASRYVRLYYNSDSNDPLEGRLTELGGGIVLRKKATRFGRLFVFWRRKDKDKTPAATTTAQP